MLFCCSAGGGPFENCIFSFKVKKCVYVCEVWGSLKVGRCSVRNAESEKKVKKKKKMNTTSTRVLRLSAQTLKTYFMFSRNWLSKWELLFVSGSEHAGRVPFFFFALMDCVRHC